MEPYTEWRYLWPPRPETTILPDMIGSTEALGWWAQFKRDGTCTDIWVDPNKEVSSMNRHKEDHRAWTQTDNSTAQLKKIGGTGWWCFVGEVLNNKISGGPKDTIYLFDILVQDGMLLTETTFSWRQEQLLRAFDGHIQGEAEGHLIVDKHLWIAKNYTKNLRALFDSLTHPMDEGLVFKDPNALLANPLNAKSNAGWQVKCRRYRKGRSF